MLKRPGLEFVQVTDAVSHQRMLIWVARCALKKELQFIWKQMWKGKLQLKAWIKTGLSSTQIISYWNVDNYMYGSLTQLSTC